MMEFNFPRRNSVFRPAYGQIGYLSNILPSVPVLALTGTAATATKSHIIDILGLSSPVAIESNPDRPNIFYASHVRPDRGEDKLEPILKPIVHELKLKKTEMPLTLIYGSLETIADSFLYFTSHKGKDQYYPSSAEPCSKNRLFTQLTTPSTRNTKETESLRSWSRVHQPTVYYLLL